ncbi:MULTISPECIES: helix-turn-helix domain-containing protein [unclassified Nocardiopsis]|uniref:helix-turn-helix domain-containing protein n=1 Tax=Nocardiopsis TaxID=2013 RepID=UPI00387B2614
MSDLRVVPSDESDKADKKSSADSPVLNYYGSELRRFREAAGLTQDELSARINYSKPKISKVETGKSSPLDPTPEDKLHSPFTGRCDEVLQTGGALGRILPLLVLTEEAYPGWFKPYAKLEAEASAIYNFQPQVVPGLLQAEDYVRALLSCRRPYIGDEKLEQRTAARLGRQHVLDREKPPVLFAVMDESALRRPIGGRTVLKKQLAHLIEQAERPLVNIAVIPTDITEHAGLDGSLVILDFPEDPSVLYLESGEHATMTEVAHEVDAKRQAFNTLCMQTLSPRASIDLMASIMGEL